MKNKHFLIQRKISNFLIILLLMFCMPVFSCIKQSDKEKQLVDKESDFKPDTVTADIVVDSVWSETFENDTVHYLSSNERFYRIDYTFNRAYPGEFSAEVYLVGSKYRILIVPYKDPIIKKCYGEIILGTNASAIENMTRQWFIKPKITDPIIIDVL